MWLLTAAVRKVIDDAYRSGAIPTAEQQLEFEARSEIDAGTPSRIMTVAGDVAEIRVAGAITNRPNFFAMLFGGGNVTYGEIISALAEADANPSIKRAELRVDSPGGHVDGLFEAVAAIQAFSKPLKGVVENTAASAAYALVSQADEVVALNKAARVGSVGIVATMYVDDNEVQVTSTEAPKKRPDVRTDEGKAVVREELDALHELFVDAIATGRDTTVDKVNADFGQGSTLLAKDALKRGMIDAIQGGNLRVVESTQTNTTASGGNKPETVMDLNTLKAQHPDVYAAALQEGVNSERDRVSAHLTMGAASGDMETALKAVKEGSEMTATLQATYLAAGMNRQDQQNRQDDDAGANAADGADEGSQASASEDVLSAVEDQLGITGE